MSHITCRVFLLLACIGCLVGFGEAWASFAARPYFPIQSGNLWNYNGADGSTFTATVLPGATDVNGIPTTVIQASDGSFADYITNDSSGVRLHRQFDADVGITATYSPPIKFANAVTDIGQTVNSSGTAVTNLGNLSYTSTYTIQAFENITVPAGTFATVRLQGTITLCSGPTCETATHTIYLARNIGLIKEIGNSSAGSYTNELTGTNVDPVSVTADFDGDRKTDLAVYRNGLWIYSPSSGGANVAVQFGGGTDVAVPADYDGDGETDVAVYRSGLWIYQPSSGGANVAVQFGGGTDVPLPADYDGDAKTDIAVYRNGLWIYQPSSGGANVAVQFGGGTDIPIPADYDGDGKTDIAVYRSGLWIYQPSSGGANVAVQFGGGTDIPMPADYDGDGKTDIAVYRSGLWIYQPSSGGANVATQFGGGTDVPLN